MQEYNTLAVHSLSPGEGRGEVPSAKIASFWRSLQQVYPDAMEHFNTWLEKYKLQINWTELFCQDLDFNDLPFEMQNGIIARYEIELLEGKSAKAEEVYYHITAGFKKTVRNIFHHQQNKLISRSASAPV